MAAPKLIVILGETASGKSALAIELAKQFNGEIICADSRTIYKGMDIGTAKPNKAEQAGVTHHLLDIIEPGQTYSAAQFKEDALRLVEEINNRGKVPIIVGGTGLYIDAVLFDYQFARPGTKRDKTNSRHLEKIETKKDQTLRPNTLVIGLRLDREILKKRIEQRVELMVKKGLIEEVKELGEKYGWNSEAMSGIGYRFFGQHIRGEVSLEESKAKFVQGDMSLAKRQRTWFKRNKYIHWFADTNQVSPLVKTFLSKPE